MTELLFDIAERHAQDFPVPESALTVMPMTSGAAAASADLDLLYRDLRAAHLHPLWRIERNLLTEHPMPRAIPWVWRAADMYPLGERAIRAVPVNRERSGGPVTPSSSCSAATVAARLVAADWSGPRETCSWSPPGCPPRTGRESARTCSNCRTHPCCARSVYTAKRLFREAGDQPFG